MDDDIVLNIDLSQNGPAKNHGNKGGRWVDRLKVKRAGKRKAQPQRTSSKPSLDGNTTSDDRPAKRPRQDVDVPRPTSSDSKPTTSNPVARPLPTQFISSLFTSNPKVDMPKKDTSEQETVSKPSNAPLDSSSFSGLGLHPLLATHLTSKMNILKPTAIQKSALSALLSEHASDRDVFIQAQTGSGKTLSYLLPIIHDLLPLSSHSYIDRSIGTLAVIIAPTRELAKQISEVLEVLLKLRLRSEDESAENPDHTKRLTRWLVSGLLIGGENRTHEKARLRKGVPILVSTPGRLLDHLQNTSSLNIGKCRWLVLDEADHLMELGFEETITGIMKGLEGRHRLAKKAVEEGKSMEVGGWDWDRRQRTILCSATMREDVQKLAGTALINPLIIKTVEVDNEPTLTIAKSDNQQTEKFTPPTQLSQKYVVAPLKLRLVTLVALLRTLIAQSYGRRSIKIIVFFSCTDSVDFHWRMLAETSMGGDKESPNVDDSHGSEDEGPEGENKTTSKAKEEEYEGTCPLLPGTSIFRLHGSLPTQSRLQIVKGFSAPSKSTVEAATASSILLCTSVASRGLDLPLVRAVVQYDLPTEGGSTEYVHRVGRTARAGKGGEAWSIIGPSETAWVSFVQDGMQNDVKDGESSEAKGNASLTAVGIEEILKSGFGGRGQEYEERATEVQLAFERWVIRENEYSELARKAFLSHMRAYATHPSNEKHIFHIRHLHLGHLAKAFALRDAPKAVGGTTTGVKSGKTVISAQKKKSNPSATGKVVNEKKERYKELHIDHSGDAEKRMQEVVRAQGRLSKTKGIMMRKDASEFQIAGGYDLEKLVRGS